MLFADENQLELVVGLLEKERRDVQNPLGCDVLVEDGNRECSPSFDAGDAHLRLSRRALSTSR